MIAGTNPFPTQLGGVTVFVNGVPAPLFSVAFANGEDQISFQVPYAAPTGPNAVEITVFDHGAQTADFFADSFTEDPGIFMYPSGNSNRNAVAVSATDFSLIGPGNPTFPGEILVLYTTGLGPLSLSLVDGYGAPSDPLARTIDPFQVLVDNEQCEVLFSGLAPGFVGLYQVNFRVPGDARSGFLNLQIQSPFANSGVTVLDVQQQSNHRIPQ